MSNLAEMPSLFAKAIDKPTLEESETQISSLLYSMCMLWQHRSDKIYRPDIPLLIWLTNAFSEGKAKLPEDFSISYGSSPISFGDYSHTEVERTCRHNMMIFAQQMHKDKTSSKPPTMLGHIMAKLSAGKS